MITRGFLTLCTAAVLAASGFASPAAAQQTDGPGNVEARQALATLGQCLVGIRANDVRAYLQAPTPKTWRPVTYYRNDDAPCVGLYSVQAEMPAMRGAVAEAWYLANYASGPANFPAASNVAPPQTETAALIVAAAEADRPQVVVDEFARCVAAVAPTGVDALLRTSVASSEEKKAISALSTHFAPCAFEGQKLAFSTEMLRAALSYALARRVVNGTAI